MNLEIEFKLLLDNEDAATRLENRLQELGLATREPMLQLNHYFDTASAALRMGRCALRLRLQGELHLVTCKGAAEAESLEGAAVQLETQAAISAELSGQVLAGEACPLEALRAASNDSKSELLARIDRLVNGEALLQVGRFANLRKTFGPWALPSGATLLLELDRTDFGSRTDFELEAEVRPEHAREARGALEELLTHSQVEWRPAVSKAQRLFELSS